MTDTQLDKLTERVMELWPRSRWTATEYAVFRGGIRNLDLADEQWRACIDECRRESRWATPEMDQLIRRLRGVHDQSRRRAELEARGVAPASERRGWRETPEEAAEVERGRRAAVEFIHGLTDEDLAAIAEAAAGRVEKFWPAMARDLRLPVAHLRAKLARNVHLRGLLHAVHRMACLEAAGGRRSA